MIRSHGNVSQAARALRMPAADLRRMVCERPELLDVALEQTERAIDLAEAAVLAGLASERLNERLAAAAFILAHSPAAKRRGWRSRRSIPELEAVKMDWSD